MRFTASQWQVGRSLGAAAELMGLQQLTVTGGSLLVLQLGLHALTGDSQALVLHFTCRSRIFLGVL